MNTAVLQTQLQLPYRTESWRDLLRKLFSDIDLFAQPIERPLTTQNETALANDLVQFGRATLADGKLIGLFEVKVAAGVDLARNRVGLRRLIARCIDEVNAHAVLAFFVQPESDQYRLSYAARESIFDVDTLAIETRETAKRRYTYVLGPREPVRTAAQRLAALSDKRGTAELRDVTAVFSVERLNDEFFATYKKHYELFCDHLFASNAPKILFKISVNDLDDKARDRALKPVRDFVKKLLGRLVFLYFLQKKGWLGCPRDRNDWQNGDAQFIRKLFDTCANKDRFHSKRLVPLFFDTLNNSSRPNDVFAITSTRVPYLNGGLFERDFDHIAQIDFPAPLFADLLEFFGQYNFTIDENDPDDREIGIDPEMLGHIFENLLEYNKDKGAYYTPKPVVQYMCQQSLIYYLRVHFPGDDAEATSEIERLIRRKDPIDPRDSRSWVSRNAQRIDELLDTVKICDPAIGSGAFPMGLLQEIYWTKLTLHPSADRAATKRAIIQQSIHGVDIDAGAVEIARLRCWLALIVDEPAPLPLPNLDYQIMQGNSLLESYEGIDLSNLTEPIRFGIRVLGSEQHELGLPKIQTELIEDTSATQLSLADLETKYFACHDPVEKARLRNEIDAAVLRAIDERLARRREELEISIQQRDAFQRGRATSLAEKKKRKAMQAELDSLAETQSRLHALLADSGKERPFFLWHFWFRHIFGAKGGFDIIIANPPYINAIEFKKIYGTKIREELKDQFVSATGAWDLYVLFIELALTVVSENGIICLINPNKYLAAPYAEGLRNYILQHAAVVEIVDVSCIRTFRQVDVYPVISFLRRGDKNAVAVCARHPRFRKEQDFDIRNFDETIVPSRYLYLLPERIWGLLLSRGYSLLDNVIEVSKPLHECGEVNATSTASEADSYGTYFVEDSTARWRVVNTGLIERYESLWGREKLIHQGNQYTHPVLPESSPVSTNRRKLYSAPKIIFAKMASNCEAFTDLEGEFASVNTNCFYAPSDERSLKFFAAVFNSRAFMQLYELYFGALRMAGGYFQWGSPQLRVMPIPHSSEDDEMALVSLVDEILAAKQAGDEGTAKQVDDQIDRIVFRLYGLRDDEINTIESLNESS